MKSYLSLLPDEIYKLIFDMVEEDMNLRKHIFGITMRELLIRAHSQLFQDVLRIIDKSDESNDDE